VYNEKCTLKQSKSGVWQQHAAKVQPINHFPADVCHRSMSQAALGLWKELTETASTPSTVLPMGRRGPLPRQYAASSVTTDQSAA